MIIVYTWNDAEETTVDYVISTNCDLDVLAGELLKEADIIRDDFMWGEVSGGYNLDDAGERTLEYAEKYGITEDFPEIAEHVFHDAGYDITFEDFAEVQRGSI